MTAVAPAPQLPRRELVTAASLARLMGNAYRAGSTADRQTLMWQPSLKSADAEILVDAGKVRARARDLYRNHPTARNAVRLAVQAVIGKKLRWSTRVNYKFLGIEAAEAKRWGAEFDRIWDDYAHGGGANVDAGRRLNFSQMMRLALKTRMVDGEAFGAFEWDPSRPWKTCLQIIDTDRISTPTGKLESAHLRAGVVLNDYTAPLGYYVRNAHPSDVGVDAAQRQMTWSYVPRETGWNRRVMAHSFQMERANQTRGISDFTTVAEIMQNESEFWRADLNAAVAQSNYALVIKSSADYVKAMESIGVTVEYDENGDIVSNPVTDMALQQLASLAGYYNEAKIRFADTRIAHLAPGDELQMVQPGNRATSAPDFSKAAVKRMAAGLGSEPVALAADYSQVNYSSARMSVAQNWTGYEITRGDLVYDLGLPLVRNFLEETVFAGALKLPKGVAEEQFYAALPALARGVFLTNGPPMLDPTKERQGHQMGWTLGLDTLEELAAEEGEDIWEKLDQKALEIQYMRERGIPLPGEPVMPPASLAPNDSPSESRPPGADGGSGNGNA